jgi:predicted AlkP superfamily pyrophosphatase or phosphodiesterase
MFVMKSMYSIHKALIFTLFFNTLCLYANKLEKPSLTIIIVVDQFAEHYLEKLYPHFQYGLKTLIDNGIVYKNAIWPHGMPATGTGHTAANTGAYAKDHGITGNGWSSANGEKIACDDDTAENAAVFAPQGLYDYGKSARNIMVDGISDQFVLASQPNDPHVALSFSLKSRAAICTAGHLGKAIWFDSASGSFTSSKAYYDKLPQWVVEFSQKNRISNNASWQLMYPETSDAYNFYHTHDYTYANRPYSSINKPTCLNTTQSATDKRDSFSTSPDANKLIFDVALAGINAHTTDNPRTDMLVWVCVSSLDKLGHTYGTEVIEILDMIYQLDKQIQDFMEEVTKKFDKKEVLFALTADHGSGQIVELMHNRGLTNVKRILAPELTNRLNEHLQNLYHVKNLVAKIKQPHCYLNTQLVKNFNAHTQQRVIDDIKSFLLNEPGIKQVWGYDELYHLYFNAHQMENYFKQQLFKGRSGALIIQTYPYVIITNHSTGLGHKTPYNYDTHIPLILYQAGSLEKKTIYEWVWGLQLANTLAQILHVQKPSASTFNALPGIFDTP